MSQIIQQSDCFKCGGKNTMKSSVSKDWCTKCGVKFNYWNHEAPENKEYNKALAERQAAEERERELEEDEDDF